MGEFNFVEQVAVPLPAVVLTELLGLPAGGRDRLLGWANSTLRPGAAPRARDTLSTMQEIIAIALEHGRSTHTESMLGRLVQAETLSSGELTGLLFYLVLVWYEVLVDVIAGAVLAFSTCPTQLDESTSAPDPFAAVDELLRFLPPQVLAGPRFAMSDIEMGGQRITGQTVLLCLAAANHDPERFSHPDELDAHWPRLRAIGDENAISWRSGFRHRGPLTLPVKPR